MPASWESLTKSWMNGGVASVFLVISPLSNFSKANWPINKAQSRWPEAAISCEADEFFSAPSSQRLTASSLVIQLLF